MVKEGFFGVGLGGSAREIPNEVKREDVGGVPHSNVFIFKVL